MEKTDETLVAIWVKPKTKQLFTDEKHSRSIGMPKAMTADTLIRELLNLKPNS